VLASKPALEAWQACRPSTSKRTTETGGSG
jgi:hypothetical protein